MTKTNFLHINLPEHGDYNWGCKLNKAITTIDQEIMMLYDRASGNWNHTDEALTRTKRTMNRVLFLELLILIYNIALTVLVLTK